MKPHLHRRCRGICLALAGTMALASGHASATIPVIDVAAIAQLRSQLDAWRSQLTGMAQQLGQLQQTYAAVTGQRGLQAFLPITTAARNYLPVTWPDATAALGSFGPLAGAVASQQSRNAVLSAADLARFPVAIQALVTADRRETAANAVATQAAYTAASSRFTGLQTLIERIGSTPDAKSIAELQGRIAAEQAMLANEALKLTALNQVATAEAAVDALRERELVVASHGSFTTRFQPTPPAP